MASRPEQLGYMFTLQGPTAEGQGLIESWSIPEEMYVHMRNHMGKPIATTLTDMNGNVISTRFHEEGD